MPSPTSSAPVLRLSSPDDVFAAVPYLLGFHPTSSLVVLGLSGPRSRLGVSMRLDLGVVPPEEMAATVARALTDDRDTEAIVLLYDPMPVPGRPSRPPGQDVVTALRAAFRPARIQIRDAMRISDGRWWSYLCRDPRCCSPTGTPIRSADEPGGPSRVAATAVHAGMAALPDRAALRAGLDVVSPQALSDGEQALEEAGDDIADLLERDSRIAVEQFLLDHIEELTIRFRSPRAGLDVRDAASVAIALHFIEVRDVVITWTLREDAEALQTLLTEVVRRIPAPSHVPAATVLAWCAYLRGKGALAGVALELVQESDPGYSLACLLDTMLQNGIHPDRLRETTAQTETELRRRRRDAARGQEETGTVPPAC